MPKTDGTQPMKNERFHSHIPAPDRRQPVSTYRLQLTPEFTFDHVIEILPYLSKLGVTDVYFSPILQAAPGSTHGYDVVDHAKIAAALGGIDGFRRASRAIHDAGMHLVVDVVPNHMSVPTPLYHNRALWSVLREGQDSPFTNWFDIELSDDADGLLLPVLGERIGDVLAKGEIELTTMVVPGFEDDGEMPILRYFDHVFPVRKGTESLPLFELLDRQHYRLAYWRVANEELNYRRFFDVDTLAAIRVELDDVFRESHALLLDLFNEGLIDAFRIDHPDGLADPRQYFRNLHEATGGAWLVAEKILEGEESLPSDWPCAGTTGYDALRRVQGLITDPSGIGDMVQIYAEISGETESVASVEVSAKRQIVSTSLYAEVDRLANLIAEVCRADVRLRDHTFRSILDALSELIIHMPRYRAYVIPGERPTAEDEGILRAAAEQAARNLDDDQAQTLTVVVDLLLGNEIGSAGRTHEDRRQEAIIRFQQVCGAVMAKGVEDTTFYRYTALISANEVGGGPAHFTCSPDEFHAWQSYMQQAWPVSGITTTTHDTKRGEDVRAVVAALSEYSKDWMSLLMALRPAVRSFGVDGQIENLIWQTVIGSWTPAGPIQYERLEAYLLKAAREQKSWTTWTESDDVAEATMLELAKFLVTDEVTTTALSEFFAKIHTAVRTNILSARALHMTIVGVSDLYQGQEITQNSLVDPDNRRPVDYDRLAAMLTELDVNGIANNADLDTEKLWFTSKLLRLRRRYPQLASAQSRYAPLPVSTGHAIAFVRTIDEEPQIITVASRLTGALEHSGGFGAHSVVIPEGDWVNIFTGAEISGGTHNISDVLSRFPAAVLERK